MGVDALYLLNEKKQIRRVIVWGVYELIHDEATYELDAEIGSEYDARPGEFLAFFDVDAHLKYFEINTAEKDERRGVTVVTATDAAVDELAHLIVPEIRLTGAKAQEAAQAALAGSGWQLGSVTDTGKTSDLSAYRDTRWKALRDIAVQYQARVTPYFVIENGEIIGKRVDVTARENVFRGRLFEGTSAGAQIYVTRSGAPITRMYGVGKAIGTEDPPTCVSFADIVWSKAAGDPADKPAGQAYIEDADAAAQYGEEREGVFTDKYIEDPADLIRATWAELQKRKQPKVSGTATAQDMEHIPGYEHMIVRMYDLVWVRTKHGEDVQAVVINVKRNYLRRGLTKIQIGEEADDNGLIKKIAKISGQTNANGKSSAAQANRYIETKRLIQLNANAIQLNAGLIEGNAEQIKLTASNLKKYEQGTDKRLGAAELTLYGDEEGAQAGLVTRMEDAEGEISRAALTLYGDGTSANAGIVAVYGGRIALVEAMASANGTAILAKADTTYVDDLVADEIDAMYANIGYSKTDKAFTKDMTVQKNAWIAGTMTASSTSTGLLVLDGDAVDKVKIRVLKSISGTGEEENLLVTDVGNEETVSFQRQGDLFLGTAFDEVETKTFELRGEAVEDELHTVRPRYVTPIGNSVENTYPTLYAYEGDGQYSAVNTSRMYYAGTQRTYYEIVETVEPGTLYYDGGEETATVGTVEHTTALYQPGSKISITTQDVTALTAAQNATPMS